MPPAPSPSQARYRPEMIATVERRLSDLALDAHASSATGRVLPLGETDFPPAPAVRTVSPAALAQGFSSNAKYSFDLRCQSQYSRARVHSHVFGNACRIDLGDTGLAACSRAQSCTPSADRATLRSLSRLLRPELRRGAGLPRLDTLSSSTQMALRQGVCEHMYLHTFAMTTAGPHLLRESPTRLRIHEYPIFQLSILSLLLLIMQVALPLSASREAPQQRQMKWGDRASPTLLLLHDAIRGDADEGGPR
jgi:hypothetical protein